MERASQRRQSQTGLDSKHDNLTSKRGKQIGVASQLDLQVGVA